MRLLMTAASLTLATMIACSPVSASLRCNAHDAVRGILATKHGEAVRWRGLGASGHLFEVWVNGKTGKWTILRVSTRRIACLMMHGEAATFVKPAAQAARGV